MEKSETQSFSNRTSEVNLNKKNNFFPQKILKKRILTPVILFILFFLIFLSFTFEKIRKSSPSILEEKDSATDTEIREQKISSISEMNLVQNATEYGKIFFSDRTTNLTSFYAYDEETETIEKLFEFTNEAPLLSDRQYKMYDDYIYFNKNRDIFRLSINTKKVEQITFTNGKAGGLYLSPDGNNLAYVFINEEASEKAPGFLGISQIVDLLTLKVIRAQYPPPEAVGNSDTNPSYYYMYKDKDISSYLHPVQWSSDGSYLIALNCEPFICLNFFWEVDKISGSVKPFERMGEYGYGMPDIHFTSTGKLWWIEQDSTVWVADKNGENKEEFMSTGTDSSEFNWSPEDRFVFIDPVSKNDSNIKIVLNQNKDIVYTDDTDRDISFITWSPDSSYVLYIDTNKFSEKDTSEDYILHIYNFNSKQKARQVLETSRKDSAFGATVSQKSGKLYFIHESDQNNADDNKSQLSALNLSDGKQTLIYESKSLNTDLLYWAPKNKEATLSANMIHN